MSNLPCGETVLADATGSLNGCGKVDAVAATTGKLLVRCPNSGFGRTEKIDWRIKSDQTYGYTFFRSRTVPTATITLADATQCDDTDTFVLNGITYTAETTAGDAAWASRKWLAGNADAIADAVQLAALINADATITPNGSTNVGDTITVVTVDDTGASTTYTYTAAASPVYASRIFDQSGNQAAELASIVLALNHRRNVTLASVSAGDTFTVAGSDGKRYTYTAHATTTTAASRQFSVSGTNSQDGDELVTCLNDATYGVPGYTAVNNAGTIHFRRNSRSVPEPQLSSSNATRLACVNTAGGVPGVVAAATGATGELALTPTWVRSITVTTSNNTRLATTDIDSPGLYASAASRVITLYPYTPGQPAGGKEAFVMQFAQGTSDANEVVFALVWSNLSQDGAAVTSLAANSTASNGQLFRQTVSGWEHGYCYFANGAGSGATVTVGATKY